MGFNKTLNGTVWLGCTALAGYAKFVRGYNVLWLVGAYVPLWTTLAYQLARQPTQLYNNCYNYLIAKRTATVQLQEGATNFSQNAFTSSNEFSSLKSQLIAANQTLYELERELVESIATGKF